ncbi:hypothetical protein ACFLXH_05185 [Chloroflexota bacterium]
MSQTIAIDMSESLALSVVAIAAGIFFIWLILRAIEEVAITSEETAFTRDVEALKVSMREIDEERKPNLKLEFTERRPPFNIDTRSEVLFKFLVSLIHGDLALRPEVNLLAPPCFKFLDAQKGPDPSVPYADYISCRIDFGDIRKPFMKKGQFKITAPSEAGTYSLLYRLVCDGFDSGYIDFEVVVDEAEIPF